MDEGVLAAAQKFPARQRAIEALAGRDEGFRSLCDELAEAEVALGYWQRSTLAVRDQRCAEYRQIIDDLAHEVERTLDAAAAIALDAVRTRHARQDD